MPSLRALLSLALAATTVSAHYNFDRLIINGVTTGEYEFMRRTTNSNSPLPNIQNKDMVCNVGGLDAANRAATKTAVVNAGDTIGFNVRDIMGHPGPVNVYMSKAPAGVTAQNYLGDGDWFKVYALGVKQFRPSKGVIWGSMPDTAPQGIPNVQFTLPTALPAGEYLVRMEHIAIHGASEPGGAQFYIGCGQLTVRSSGTGVPSPTVKFPGAYKGNEPGLVFPVYWPPMLNYTMPGPATWPNKCDDHTPNVVGQKSDGDCTPILPCDGC
ncbi:glycosyl hydrolase family 61-domain-containing protein [Pterulicium gracile]|uniref:lytic cellulose monooxygenase (C4-dehydrogenating) n=1 Tax=Pterulicium gracile TaxID=1884261 RepID=A0A5C3QV73_9AGAR|nr:glycosyl hydrolase family 61-domain-containing protein [Pterula gracilis]